LIVKEYSELDGIKIFDKDIKQDHRDYNAKGLDILYSQEEKHFWFIARKKFILQKFKEFISSESRIIEIGAGTGNVSRFIQKSGFPNISVGEMHLRGLNYAKTYGVKDCYQFDLLDTPFDNEFDVVCMFDVLKHIEDDILALQNVNKMLKKNGKIILTVPAHMWLWSKADEMARHKVRYNKKDLIDKLENSGFKVLNARYFFISIVPLLLLRRLFKGNSSVEDESQEDDMSINPLISKILLFISHVENKLNRFLPNLFGGSLLVVAKK